MDIPHGAGLLNIGDNIMMPVCPAETALQRGFYQSSVKNDKMQLQHAVEWQLERKEWAHRSCCTLARLATSVWSFQLWNDNGHMTGYICGKLLLYGLKHSKSSSMSLVDMV